MRKFRVDVWDRHGGRLASYHVRAWSAMHAKTATLTSHPWAVAFEPWVNAVALDQMDEGHVQEAEILHDADHMHAPEPGSAREQCFTFTAEEFAAFCTLQIGRLDENQEPVTCLQCYQSAGWGPSHEGSETCRGKGPNASLAAGGSQVHCTCAGCF